MLQWKDRNGCKSKDCVLINEYDSPDLFLTGYPLFCKTGTTIGVNEEFSSIKWSTGDTTPEIYVDQAGTYAVTVTDEQACKDTLIVNVQSDRAIPPSLDGALAICDDQSSTLTVLNEYASIEWSNWYQRAIGHH